jgi:hypothetical protein
MLPIVSVAVPFKARAIVEAMMLLRAQQIGGGASHDNGRVAQHSLTIERNNLCADVHVRCTFFTGT